MVEKKWFKIIIGVIFSALLVVSTFIISFANDNTSENLYPRAILYGNYNEFSIAEQDIVTEDFLYKSPGIPCISGDVHYEKTDDGIDYYYAEEVPSIYYSILLRGGSKPWEKMPFEWTSIESSKRAARNWRAFEIFSVNMELL